MVDPSSDAPSDRQRKIKSIMGRTPSFIKSKFLSVLGSSNDLINGISSKLDISLSLSTSSDAETPDDNRSHNQSKNKDDDDDESIDENIIDFQSRKLKARRAYEEAISGKYIQPNFTTKNPSADLNKKHSTSFSNSNYSQSVNSTSPVAETYCDEIVSKKSSKIFDNTSDTTSENDLCAPSISRDSSDLKVWIRSESENSVPSWASSISLDSQTEEIALKFMKRFVALLFENSSSITLDIKSEFGHQAQTENGRLWFARLISAQRSKTKRVDESTFYSLIQYFAIALFECHDSEDYSPAKILMNMCFTFYHEVDVPGCEPYREYLYTYLREQPIWHSLRFWRAAFFDALQCERIHHPVPPIHPSLNKEKYCDRSSIAETSDFDDKSSISSTSNMGKDDDNRIKVLQEDQQFQQNISFGQLGTFTCNMHAFGLSRELCAEFLRKQCVIANLTKEQEKLLKDNISRMYKETAKWRET